MPTLPLILLVEEVSGGQQQALRQSHERKVGLLAAAKAQPKVASHFRGKTGAGNKYSTVVEMLRTNGGEKSRFVTEKGHQKGHVGGRRVRV
jgi:hypothetical protein